MKLLLVEDDREIQEMLGDYLRTEAYEVVCASNGRDACRLFDEGGIGLVLLDLMIPQVSGIIHTILKEQFRSMHFQSRKMGIKQSLQVIL